MSLQRRSRYSRLRRAARLIEGGGADLSGSKSVLAKAFTLFNLLNLNILSNLLKYLQQCFIWPAIFVYSLLQREKGEGQVSIEPALFLSGLSLPDLPVDTPAVFCKGAAFTRKYNLFLFRTLYSIILLPEPIKAK